MMLLIVYVGKYLYNVVGGVDFFDCIDVVNGLINVVGDEGVCKLVCGCEGL